MNNQRRVLAPAIALLAFLVVWEWLVKALDLSPLILPPPISVIRALITQAPMLAWNAGITLVEAIAGFLVAIAGALAVALLFHLFPPIQRSLYPYAIALKSIPLVALAPLVVVWFGTGFTSKVVLAAIISFFPILVSAVHGLGSVEQEAKDLFASLSASKWSRLMKLEVPTALPFVVAGAKVAATFSVVGAVVAEFIGSSNGIGFVVKSSSYYLDTDQTFAAVAVAALTGLLFFAIVSIIERRLVFWRPGSEDIEQ